MKNVIRSLIAIGLTTIPLVVTAQSAGHAHSPESAAASKQMHESMMGGMKGMQAMKMSGDSDRDFAMMMRKHHEDGIKMAQIELDKGKDSKMKEMARKIIDSQKKEIAEFDEWLKRGK
jgi:uncharacterized protein (DUF305 family)